MSKRFSSKSNKHGQLIDRQLIKEVRQLQRIFGANKKTDAEVSNIRRKAVSQTKTEKDRETESEAESK